MESSTFAESWQLVPPPIQRGDLHYQRRCGPTMMRLWARPSRFLSNGTLARLSLARRRWIRQEKKKNIRNFQKCWEKAADLIHRAWWEVQADLLRKRSSSVNQTGWACLIIRHRGSLNWLVLSGAPGQGLTDRQAIKQPTLVDHNSPLLLRGATQLCLWCPQRWSLLCSQNLANHYCNQLPSTAPHFPRLVDGGGWWQRWKIQRRK